MRSERGWGYGVGVIPSDSRPAWHYALALFALVGVAYAGAMNAGFVGYDDPSHLLDNPVVVNRDVVGAFTTTPAVLWIPLTWLTFIAEYALVGAKPWLFHLTNVVLHGANAVLLWRVLEGATGYRWRSLAVATAFAVHPLNVESVAWITERKNVLCTFFWLLSLLAWVGYGRTGRVREYLLATLAGAAALMSKPMAVSLPVTLLLLDAWPLGRFRGEGRRKWGLLLAEKVPLFLMAVAVTAVTIRAHSGQGGMMAAEALPLTGRMLNAAANYGLYLRQLLLPFDLALLTRQPQAIPLAASVAGGVALLAMTVLAWRAWRREPSVAWGWAWFVLTLLPVCGLTQAGSEASADRFTYVPQWGIFVAVVWSVAPLAAVWPRVVRVAAGVAVLGWMLLTMRQVQYWENTLTLFDRTIAVNPKAHRGLLSAAVAHKLSGDVAGSVMLYKRALDLQPDDANAWTGLGNTFLLLGDLERARFALEHALKIAPEHAVAKANLTVVEQRAKAEK